MKSKSALIAAVLGLTASVASAGRGLPTAVNPPVRPPDGGSRPTPADILAKYDTDGDGVLSAAEREAMKAAIRAEMEAKRAAFIAKYDTDGDGVLNADERAAAKAAIEAEKEAAKLAALTEKFNALDTDSSGGISAEEWAAGAPEGASADRVAAAFAKLDADSDGSVTLEEFTAAPKRPGHGRGHGR